MSRQITSSLSCWVEIHPSRPSVAFPIHSSRTFSEALSGLPQFRQLLALTVLWLREGILRSFLSDICQNAVINTRTFLQVARAMRGSSFVGGARGVAQEPWRHSESGLGTPVPFSYVLATMCKFDGHIIKICAQVETRNKSKSSKLAEVILTIQRPETPPWGGRDPLCSPTPTRKCQRLAVTHSCARPGRRSLTPGAKQTPSLSLLCLGEACTRPHRPARRAAHAGQVDPAPTATGASPGRGQGRAVAAPRRHTRTAPQQRPSRCFVADTVASVTRELPGSGGSCSHVALRTSGRVVVRERRGHGGTVHSRCGPRMPSQPLESRFAAACTAPAHLARQGELLSPGPAAPSLSPLKRGQSLRPRRPERARSRSVLGWETVWED